MTSEDGQSKYLDEAERVIDEESCIPGREPEHRLVLPAFGFFILTDPRASDSAVRKSTSHE